MYHNIWVLFVVITRGISNVISTSKIRKIIAIKKNWIENGIRAFVFGSNPHSNADLFSRSFNDFFESVEARIIIINLIMKNNIDMIVIIIYTKFS